MSPASAAASATASAGIVLVPGTRFFSRRVQLEPAGDPAAQVELALETFSPFPLAQLYYGYVTDDARTSALVFAAYRRNFSAEETAGWAEAEAVLPEFVAGLRPAQPPPAGVTLREEDGRIEALAWDGRGVLPAAVLSRPGSPGAEAELLEEIRRRAGLDATAAVRRVRGVPEVARDKRGVVMRVGEEAEVVFTPGALRAADIRDKSAVAARDRRIRRDRLSWAMMGAALAGLAACGLLELGMLGLNRVLQARRAANAAQAPAVARLDAALGLAGRLEQISTQRLMPFEMLAAVNAKRPRTVEFTRVTTSGQVRMDIDAQTTNAADLREFESELRRLAGLERVELRDSRTREGLTTFRLEVAFKRGWTRGGGGS